MSDLQTKIKLLQIISFIKSRGGNCSWTVINNHSRVEDAWPIIEFGVKNGIFEKGAGNFYSIKSDNYSITEYDYYPFIEKGLNYLFYEGRKKSASETFHIEITARSDSKIIGRWTRPDLVVVSSKKFPYIPTNEFDIITFEVKRPEDVTVLAVFEALAHRSAASLSYVVFPVNQSKFSDADESLQRVMYECANHGVGLICINDVFDDKSFKIIIEARRQELDKARGSEFLSAVIPHEKLKFFG